MTHNLIKRLGEKEKSVKDFSVREGRRGKEKRRLPRKTCHTEHRARGGLTARGVRGAQEGGTNI